MDINHLSKVQQVLDDCVSKKQVAGVNLVIYQNDKEMGYFQSGYRNLEKKIEFNRDTICRLYSMSKPVTAVAAMILVQEGKLDLGSEIGNYIPSFWNLQVCSERNKNAKAHKSYRNILVQDLLNMTSGYTYGAWSEDCPPGEHLTSSLIAKLNKDCLGECKITTQDVAELLSKIPVSFEPGTEYNYGLSADILGAVIEKASGQKFSEFLQERIFTPLGMKDTGFYVQKQNLDRLSNVYKVTDKKLELFESPNLGIQPFMDHAPSFESGGAGLCSTLDDYLKFALMLCNGGKLNGTRILQKKTVEYLVNAKLSLDLQRNFDRKMNHLQGYTYCNLLRVAINKGECKMITENGEFGWDGWLGPYVSVDLKNNLVIVILMQKTDSGTWELTRRMKNIVYTAIQ